MNTNSSNATFCSDSSKNMTTSSVALQTFVHCLLLVVAVVGNLLVIIVVSKTSEIKSTVNYFILNMAVSDLLFSVVAIPRTIKELFSDPVKTWYFDGVFGSITCKLSYFTQDVCTAVSVLTLVAIAIDRYYAVVYPMLSGFITSTVRKVMIAVIWFTAMGFNVPYFIAFKLQIDQESNAPVCIYHWQTHAISGTAYFLISSSFLFVLPLIAMSVIYTIILITIKRSKIPGNANNSGLRRHKIRRNRKVLTMVLTVLMAFLVCWLPINIYGYLLFFRLYIPTPCSQSIQHVIVLCIAYSNAAVNPFIYFGLSENYRYAALNLLKCNNKRKPLKKSNSSSAGRNTTVSFFQMSRRRTRKENFDMIDMSKGQDIDNCGGSKHHSPTIERQLIDSN